MRMWLQASTAATYYAAMAVAADTDDAAEAASVAKAYTSVAIANLTSEAPTGARRYRLHLGTRSAPVSPARQGKPSAVRRSFHHHERLAAAVEASTAP